MHETESWGVTYERYALGRQLGKLKEEYGIQTVAEMPAHGAKAMPSIYSIGFAVAGASVTLINGFDAYRWCWQEAGVEDKVEFVSVNSIYDTGIPSSSFDFVWNFAYLAMEKNQDQLLEEMNRISKKYVAFFSVNWGNTGFHVHRALHKIKNVPWTHGNVYFNKRKKIGHFMKRHGVRVVKRGFVDCPIWPDSLGFRDMRLHREGISFDNVKWESPYVRYLVSPRFPLWIKLVYLWENLPNVSFFKTLYAHINYVIGEIR
jgi:hypothetical protein